MYLDLSFATSTDLLILGKTTKLTSSLKGKSLSAHSVITIEVKKIMLVLFVFLQIFLLMKNKNI